MRKLTYFIATSVDGFIGDPEGDGNFFYQWVGGEFLEYLKAEYPETISAAGLAQLGVDASQAKHFDTVLMGRGTYDVGWKLGDASPYAHLTQYVVTRSLTEAPDPAVTLLQGDVAAEVRRLKAEDGLGIWLCGGADLAAQLVDEIDEYVIKTYPVFAGTGMPMSRAGFAPRELVLEDVRTFDGAVVVSRYARKR
ncbi:dihydrofolate reductase family protein [Streptomyces bambusae]|uniref:dihydrofolate reductase family protein n=1 Tax=Streptomyces bambusae TaxID=1550616 RepID=UPI001CFF9030|nr:dihydrofolate reductase family protein [Streptomyces bambusae]MCB5169166.1 dihydrofolate reductase family protein [Streptomyces bambusae]